MSSSWLSDLVWTRIIQKLDAICADQAATARAKGWQVEAARDPAKPPAVRQRQALAEEPLRDETADVTATTQEGGGRDAARGVVAVVAVRGRALRTEEHETLCLAGASIAPRSGGEALLSSTGDGGAVRAEEEGERGGALRPETLDQADASAARRRDSTSSTMKGDVESPRATPEWKALREEETLRLEAVADRVASPDLEKESSAIAGDAPRTRNRIRRVAASFGLQSLGR
ncbi:unnamed protein product [Linum trigynum]|uniref:Uncharacterized protein n=1 Tax=Linum trigynum TaxID=586398 RepID=A0AAV2CBG8_9ROSI